MNIVANLVTMRCIFFPIRQTGCVGLPKNIHHLTIAVADAHLTRIQQRNPDQNYRRTEICTINYILGELLQTRWYYTAQSCVNHIKIAV